MGKSCYNKRIPTLILSIPSCHTRFNGVWVGVKVERKGNTFIHAFIANQEVYKQQVGLLCRKLHSYIHSSGLATEGTQTMCNQIL